MRRYTSIASLAVALTWKPVALVMALVCAAQWLVFDPFLFQVWSFEQAMVGSGGILNPVFLGQIGSYAIVAAIGLSCAKLPAYTLGRLRIGQKTFWWSFAAVFTGCFLIYWALQAGWTVLLFAKSQRWSGGNWEKLILAGDCNAYLHSLFPMGDIWGWCSRLALTGMQGIGSAAVACYVSQGRKNWIGVVLVMVAWGPYLYRQETEGKPFMLLITAVLSLLMLMPALGRNQRRDGYEA